VSFHCLRHSFVSYLKITGSNNAVAKELVGHSSDAINDVYTHLPIEILATAVAQLPEVTQ
jgi:site-specific recombinase XerD